MLTIKHVEKSGHESVRPAHTVCFDPAVGENNEFPKGQLVAFGVPGAEDRGGYDRFADGIVFVMNDRGSTVAKYDLD